MLNNHDDNMAIIAENELNFAIMSQEMSTLSMLLRDCKEAEDGGDAELMARILKGVYNLLGISQISH